MRFAHFLRCYDLLSFACVFSTRLTFRFSFTGLPHIYGSLNTLDVYTNLQYTSLLHSCLLVYLLFISHGFYILNNLRTHAFRWFYILFAFMLFAVIHISRSLILRCPVWNAVRSTLWDFRLPHVHLSWLRIVCTVARLVHVLVCILRFRFAFHVC